MVLTPCEAQSPASQLLELETLGRRGGGAGRSFVAAGLKATQHLKKGQRRDSEIFSEFLRFFQNF